MREIPDSVFFIFIYPNKTRNIQHRNGLTVQCAQSYLQVLYKYFEKDPTRIKN